MQKIAKEFLASPGKVSNIDRVNLKLRSFSENLKQVDLNSTPDKIDVIIQNIFGAINKSVNLLGKSKFVSALQSYSKFCF